METQTPEQFIAKLQATQEALKVALPDIAQRLTANVKALAEKNILDKGFGARYSENMIPVFFFADKSLNAGGREYLVEHGVNPPGAAKKKRKKKNEGQPIDPLGNWGEFRAANGRQNAFVDLHFSGQMFRGLVPIQPKVDGYIAVCILGATNEEVKKETSYNYQRYGDFISKALGKEEFDILEQAVIEDITEIINDKLL